MRNSGEKVGPYELISPIGAGGMGEVWKARDTRLDRAVAIKFSQAQFTERFEREARAVAALNHPNICQIYDVGEDYIVMEYVEGEPIRPTDGVRNLLDIAVQIADGLAAAHAAGFIHRDLKPDNILVTREGRVKILDFGLAKQAMAALGDATPTITSTSPGAIVGTIAYMSPEQARAQELDARSDQFSFGLILYELASGKRAFERASAAELMTAIIREEPAPLPAAIPAPLRWTIERCLAKDKSGRFDTTRGLCQELSMLRDRLSEASVPSAAASPARLRKRKLPWAVAAALVAGAASGALWQRSRNQAQPVWTGLDLGGPRVAMGPRISPDGQLLAFLAVVDGQTQVAVMKPEASSWTLLTRQANAGYVVNLSWSPDGTKLYFDRVLDKPLGIYSIPPLGGEPALVLEKAFAPQALPDGTMIVAKLRGADCQLFRLWPDSGRLEALPAATEYWDINFPLRAFPDGKEIVFFGRPADDRTAGKADLLYAMNLESHQLRPLAPNLRFADWGTIVFAVTPDGKSVVVPTMVEDTYQVTSVPRDGGADRRVLFSFPATALPWYLDMAPDGSIYIDQVQRQFSILRFPVSGGRPEETVRMPVNGAPIAFPGGQVLFPSNQGGRPALWIAHAGAEPRRWLQTAEDQTGPLALTGADEVAFLIGPQNQRRIVVASTRDGHILRRLPFDASNVTHLAGSLDGRMLYYSAAGVVWGVPPGGGEPRRIAEGDSVAVEPGGRYLYVAQRGTDATELLRVPTAGGPAETIPVPDNLHLTGEAWSSAAADEQGRILAQVTSPDTWFYRTAVIDFSRKSASLIPVQSDGDVMEAGWDKDGQVIAVAGRLLSSLWRFRPQTQR